MLQLTTQIGQEKFQ